jgi:hypothetical protein
MLAQRKLGTRDRLFKEQLQNHVDRPGRETADLATDLTPGNIQVLGQAIDQAKDPQTKALLMQELARLQDTANNLMGPVQAPPMPDMIPQDMQRMPYDPAAQRPDLEGGFRPRPKGFMDQAVKTPTPQPETWGDKIIGSARRGVENLWYPLFDYMEQRAREPAGRPARTPEEHEWDSQVKQWRAR